MLTLAYKYVALAVMLAEINYCGDRLHLKEGRPVKAEDHIKVMIDDPRGIIGFAGTVETRNYFFSFVHTGRLRYIHKMDDQGRQSFGIYRGDESIVECMENLSQVNSIISSNDAYHIATNWLVSMDVDLEKLESEKPPTVEQQLLRSPKGKDIPVPLFMVRWGKDPIKGVNVMVSGVDGELLRLRLEDDFYSKRSEFLIKDMDKLLAIPDEEFLKYSDMERSNLVVRFAAVHYPPNYSLSQLATNGSPATNSAASKNN
jgi:hypothetical protein